MVHPLLHHRLQSAVVEGGGGMMMIGNPPTTAATMMMMMDTFSNSQLYFALRLALVVDMMVAVVVDGLL